MQHVTLSDENGAPWFVLRFAGVESADGQTSVTPVVAIADNNIEMLWVESQVCKLFTKLNFRNLFVLCSTFQGSFYTELIFQILILWVFFFLHVALRSVRMDRMLERIESTFQIHTDPCTHDVGRKRPRQTT